MAITPVPTWAGVQVSVKRPGDKLPRWKDDEDQIVVQRLEGTGLSVKQRMGGTGWQVLEYVCLSLTHDAVATLLPLRDIIPRDLIDFPIGPNGAVATFTDVYLEQLGHGQGPEYYPFEPDENVETPIRFTRLAPYSTGAPGALPFTGSSGTALLAPTGVGASSPGAGQLTITWTDTNVVEQGYQSEISDDGGATWMAGGQSGANSAAMTITGLPAATYTVRVRAYNLVSFGAWGATASAVVA